MQLLGERLNNHLQQECLNLCRVHVLQLLGEHNQTHGEQECPDLVDDLFQQLLNKQNETDREQGYQGLGLVHNLQRWLTRMSRSSLRPRFTTAIRT